MLLAAGLAGCVNPEVAAIRSLAPPMRPVSSPASPAIVVAPRPAEQPLGRLDGLVIVVDPGHGGNDPGTLGGGVPEKVINGAIAWELARLLQQSGAEVVLTRSGDQSVSLAERSAAAQRSRADLFVSIHTDAARDRGVAGATVYVARGAAAASRRAAGSLKAALDQAGLDSRGVREANYQVLVGHSRPAVLVECGYLSNPLEAERLETGWYQGRIARVLAEGIAGYFGR